jgi:hypothetical protein
VELFRFRVEGGGAGRAAGPLRSQAGLHTENWSDSMRKLRKMHNIFVN